jgi:hypothetical protein
LGNLTFAIQNVNSLNISKPGGNQAKKLAAILKDNAEIIFLSDIRLNSTKQCHGIHDLNKKFASKGYDFYYNSKESSRGVGILLKKGLDFTPQELISDDSDNYILHKFAKGSTKLIFGAVYGPNKNDKAFFDNLSSDLSQLTNNELAETVIILGGDFNATWDTRNAEHNIDVINMAAIPSKFRSEKIHEMAVRF